MQFRTAILAQRIGEFEGVQLHVGISVSETLDEGGDGLCGTRGRGGNPVADVEDERPVLVDEVVGSCFY